MMTFDTIYWHDSTVLKIEIDRHNPGTTDIIKVGVLTYDDIKLELLFYDVYWSECKMNFGVVARESILRAYTEGEENSRIKDLKLKWQGNIDHVRLNYYEIETNSTGSTIKIIAKGVVIQEGERVDGLMK